MEKEMIIMIAGHPASDSELIIDELEAGGLFFNSIVLEDEYIAAKPADPPPDIIISNNDHPRPDDVQALKRAAVDYPGIPFIYVSRISDEKAAAEAISSGALDYIGFSSLGRLPARIRGALQHTCRQKESCKDKTELHYKDLYDNAPVAYLTIDPVEKKVIEFNRQVLAFLDLSADELSEKPLKELFDDSAQGFSKAEKELDRCIRDGKAGHHAELKILKSGRDAAWISLSMAPVLNRDRNIVEVRAVALDISRRKQLEDQLEKTQKLEAIATLAGGISHDFNNILSSIMGYTELSLVGAPPGSKLEDYLKEIYTAGVRAKDLVHQILAFCRTSEQRLMPTRIHLIVKEAMKMLRPTFPSFIDIKCTINTNAKVLAEPARIHQLLMNLCTNALYAMEERGGVLELSLSEITLSESEALLFHGIEPGDYVRLDVSDTGSGMSSEVREMIFDPYFTTREKAEGTGLGLSIALGIVKSMDGDIQVSSREGEGTVFTIMLPRIASRDRAGASRPDKLLPGGNERILLVDDELAIVKMVTNILSNYEYRVIAETDSLKALDYFRSNPQDIDIVITDMTMPSLTGEMLAAEMISIRPEIPVILCTGNSSAITPEIAAKSGIRAILNKPFSRKELLTTVRGILDAHPVKSSRHPEKTF